MSQASEAEYELYYWPGLQGRGEFIRLAFEEAGVRYRDVAREPAESSGGVKAIQRLLKGEIAGVAPLAPPILKHGSLVIAQVAAILAYLGPRLGLVPDDETSRIAALQHQLTVADFVGEAHDSHHPVAVGAYYEDQKTESARRSKEFTSQRIPKFLAYFERALARNDAGSGHHLVGASISYVDLSLFQVVEGLRYAFPRAAARHEAAAPRVVGAHDLVGARPRIRAYLGSPRRLAFNETGIFRRYPELDEE